MTHLLVIDNYDSFTYNLVQELGQVGATVSVVRNDAFSVDDLVAAPPDGVVISPGPGTPDDAGASMDVIRALAGVRPVLGVCLGHQCLGQVYGGRIVPAPDLVHGKTSPVHHRHAGVLNGLPTPFAATRYHSLLVDAGDVPEVLEVTARTSDGLIMGLRHRVHALEGVQFHPESILTTVGLQLLGNFVASCATGPVEGGGAVTPTTPVRRSPR